MRDAAREALTRLFTVCLGNNVTKWEVEYETKVRGHISFDLTTIEITALKCLDDYTKLEICKQLIAATIDAAHNAAHRGFTVELPNIQSSDQLPVVCILADFSKHQRRAVINTEVNASVPKVSLRERVIAVGIAQTPTISPEMWGHINSYMERLCEDNGTNYLKEILARIALEAYKIFSEELVYK